MKKVILYIYQVMLLFSVFSAGIIIYGYLVGDNPKAGIFPFFGLIFATIIFYLILKFKGWK